MSNDKPAEEIERADGKRKPGFYWLRSKDKWSIGEWRETWWITQSGGWFKGSDFDEIDENQIERNIAIRSEEIKTLDELIIEFNSKPYGVSLERFIYSYFAIHIKAQQLKEYKEVIRELLDIAEIHVNRHGNDYSVVDRYAIVRNARKLIDQPDSTK